MDNDYANRHVVVTGATGALGTAVVGQMIDRGAFCHIPCRQSSDLERFVYRNVSRVSTSTGVELTDESAVVAYYQSLPEIWASVHVAGGFSMAPIVETSLTDFRRMLDVNGVTCFLCCREAVRRIRSSGDGGRIVNVGARPALIPAGGMVAYAASKAAVTSISQCLAEEVAAEGILINAVIPAIMDTPANRQAMPDADHRLWPKVAEVAEIIVNLASPRNRVARGGLIPVYGRS